MEVECKQYREDVLALLKAAAAGYSVHDMTEYIVASGVDGINKLTTNLVHHPQRVAVVFFTRAAFASELGRTAFVYRVMNSAKNAPFILFHADDYFVPHGELDIKQMVESALTILPGRVPLCVICMEEVGTEAGSNQLPCGHQFHVACIDRWLVCEESDCPVCRQPTEFRVRFARVPVE